MQQMVVYGFFSFNALSRAVSSKYCYEDRRDKYLNHHGSQGRIVLQIRMTTHHLQRLVWRVCNEHVKLDQLEKPY